ncbi:MAG: TonB-dependent receptor plug domain-containing protein [Acidobacteriia bacterium]|nr:TonB-dependent receptor plug domain-containing protein [Terriglobia bacterium]
MKAAGPGGRRPLTSPGPVWPGCSQRYYVLAAALLPALCVTSLLRGSNEYSSNQDPNSQTANPAALKQLSLEQLSQIDVTTASKEPVPAFRSPVAIYVITGQDIRRSGVIAIPDALRLAPGVEVAQIDSSKWSVGIRGFGTRLSRDVLVLIDGRTVYTPLFAGTYWEVQDTLLEDIDRIEVIRGPGGTIWGPNAVNGVINIITKSSKDTKGLFASAGGGNVEQGFVNFRYGAGNSNGLTWRIYGKGFTRGPEYHPDRDNFDDWRGGQGGFRLDWSPKTNETFSLQGDLYKQEDGERVNASTYVPPMNYTFNGYEQASGGNVLFRWTKKLSDTNDYQLQLYYDRTNRSEPNLGDRLHAFDIDFQARRKLAKRQQLLYGVEGRLSPAHFVEVASGLVFSPPNRTNYLVSAFIQDEISLVENRLLLTLGTKLLHTNYTGAQAEPSIRLMWTPNQRQAFWAAFTHAVRTPSDAEEDFFLSSFLSTAPNGTETFARFNANPLFAPEKLNGYEIGYRQLIAKNVYLDVAGFFNNYHDLFSQDLAGPTYFETTLPFPINTPPPPPHYLLPAQFGNSLYGRTTGGEIAPEWRPVPHWRLLGSYSYLSMNLSRVPGIALGETPASVVGASPRHQATARSSVDVSDKLQIDLVYRYVSALPAVSAAAYSTGDARIAWRFRNGFELSAAGRNLLQPLHVEYTGDPGGSVWIRRSVFATLAWMK